MTISRRSLLWAGTGLVAGRLTSPRVVLGSALQPAKPSTEASLTAAQIVDRIKAHVGIPWRAETVDNIVGGTPGTMVKGIGTTMMATLDVLRRAAAAGRNMVITHESTFFSHEDRAEEILTDPTYLFKVNFIKEHDLVVFHFHDHWHFRRPDGIFIGMARELGWDKYVVGGAEAGAAKPGKREGLFQFPGVPLAELARAMQSRLNIRTMRVIGDPSLKVGRILASWGHLSLMPGIPYLARPDVDVLVVGETREWELVEYVQDQISSGLKKALIVLGHVVSEQAGMKYCAEWLKTFIDDVPIDFIAADEPFWRPDHPVAPRRG